MMGPQWEDMGLGLREPWTVQMEVDGQTMSQGASTPLQTCIGVADPWLLIPHDSCANIISFSSALHIHELGQSAKCQWQALQARALRGMPSQLSGANKDKNIRSSKIDRDSRIPIRKEREKPEGMGIGEGCSVLNQERRILHSFK